jgi:WD40 repeat protein
MYGFLLREMLAGLYVAFEVSAGDDTTVTFWELKGDGALFAQLEGHRGAIWAIQSVGSAMFATGAADDTIRLWKRAD